MNIVVPKLSIVVAVYNVEKYLLRCVNSILDQSFKDFELLLIDDGSFDFSGNICDEYGKKDNRVRVFHKKNGGAASAKNFGVRMARGKYIGFVDSDDWIEKDMYLHLVNVMEKYMDVDICIGMYKIDKNNTISQIPYTRTFPMKMDTKKALECMFQNRFFDWSLCDKVYKRNLFTNNQICPNDVQYGDDTAANWILFNRANNIYYLPIYSYHYCMRDGSLVHQEFSEKKLSLIDVLKKIDSEINMEENAVVKMRVQELLIYYLINFILEMMCSSHDFREQVIFYQKILNFYMEKQTSNIKWNNLGYEKACFDYDVGVNYMKNKYHEIVSELVRFCEIHNRVFIYGIGEISDEIIRIMKNENIEYHGFLVSCKSVDNEYYKDKFIFGGDEISRNVEKEKDGIILCMNYKNTKQVMQSIIGEYSLFNAGKYSLKYNVLL